MYDYYEMTENQENEIGFKFYSHSQKNDDLDSYFGERQPQQLSHLNKKRAKRQNVTRPTNRNPQARLKDTVNINQDLTYQSNEITEETRISFEKLYNNSSSRIKANNIDQPKVSLDDLTKVKLRRTINSKPNTQQNPDQTSVDGQLNTNRLTFNRNSTHISDFNKLTTPPQSAEKLRNRISMFEQKTYIAPEPHSPTKYLEVFNLENPKFDQDMLTKPQETRSFTKDSQLQSNNSYINCQQPRFKRFETYFAKPVITSEIKQTVTANEHKNVQEPIFFKTFVAPKLTTAPQIEPVKKPTPRMVTQISVKPSLKSVEKIQPVIQQTLSPPPVRLRSKKAPLNDDATRTKQNKINKFANRFSMFEPACQKSFNKLKLNEFRQIDFENRSYQNTFIEIDRQEIPTSVKDRIKMFSQ